MTDNAIHVWDFTYFHESEAEIEEVVEILRRNCKKWVFQEEVSPTTDRKHLQGRVSLKTKSRTGWRAIGFPERKGRASPTHDSKEEHFDFYATKEESRIGAVRSDKDPVLYVPDDVKEDMKTLLPWQQQLFEICKITTNRRKIYYVYEPNGGFGKTMWTRWMMAHGHGEILPLCDDYKDMMRMVMCIGPKNTYMVDVPKAMPKKKLASFYSAVETIKGGYAYDDRYSFKRALFRPPNIVVFSNNLPNLNMLSWDRWVILSVTGGQLVQYSTDQIKELCQQQKAEAEVLKNNEKE